MSKLLIITYHDTSLGFNLAGAEVKEINEKDDVTVVLNNILKDGSYGLLAIEEGLLSKVEEGVLKRMKKSGIPLIVPINTPKSWHGGAAAESYISKLIRRAIGYQVKIKR